MDCFNYSDVLLFIPSCFLIAVKKLFWLIYPISVHTISSQLNGRHGQQKVSSVVLQQPLCLAATSSKIRKSGNRSTLLFKTSCFSNKIVLPNSFSFRFCIIHTVFNYYIYLSHHKSEPTQTIHVMTSDLQPVRFTLVKLGLRPP